MKPSIDQYSLDEAEENSLTAVPDPGQKWSIVSSRSISLEVVESFGVLDANNETLAANRKFSTVLSERRLVVVDESVEKFYGDRISLYYHAHNLPIKLLVLPALENEKRVDRALQVVSMLSELGTSRRSAPITAIGGGVVQDVAGFAASMYRRGVPYIRVPTTLLSQVDVSVAAKTGVNYDGFRNRIGAYHPPVLTIVDHSFLRSLPMRQVVNGLGEVLKLAIIQDSALFLMLESEGGSLVSERCSTSRGKELIRRSITCMLSELEGNLWEDDLRRSVDFGHSFSPLVEMRAWPDLLHGEAVALDCILSSIISNRRGLLQGIDLKRILATSAALGLPTFHPLYADKFLLAEALREITIHRDGTQNLPLPTGIGSHIFVNDVTPREISDASAVIGMLTDGTAGGRA